MPGIPPVFGGTIAYVAEKEGMFKKHGVDVTVRAFETGAAASRAVASGEIAVALSPSPLVVSQVANTDVPLVGIWGMEHPDWLIGSTDPNATCESLKGAPIGVDSVGGARSIALSTMLIGGCKMKIEDVQQVALSSNVGAAMIAGQLKFGVLHIDDIPVIEAETKKPLKVVVMAEGLAPRRSLPDPGGPPRQAGEEPRRLRAHRRRADRGRALHARSGQRTPRWRSTRRRPAAAADRASRR